MPARVPPADPRVLGCRCDICPHAVDGRALKPVWGEYPAPEQAEGILCGEGPGETEEEMKKPFQGLTGKELDHALARAGIPRSRQVVVNAQKCRPIVKSAANMKRASDCCRPALEWELEPYRGKPMFLMGKWAWYSVARKVPKGGLEKGRGFVRKGEHKGTPFTYIATWHPTYAAFRNPFEWGVFQLDLARYRRLMDGKLRPRPTKLVTSPTLKDIARVVKDARGLPSLDIETAPEDPKRSYTAKDPLRAKLCLVGLGCSEWGLSVDWNRAPDSMRQALWDVVKGSEAPRVSILTHNGPWYDHRNLARYGFKLNPFWEDTRDARRAVSATSRLSLAYCSTLYDDPDPWKEEDGDEDDEKGLIVVDDVEAWKRYNAVDCVETSRVWDGITAEPEWREQRVLDLYELQKRRSVASACMHTTGLFLDKQERARLSRELTSLHDERMRKLVALVGLPGFTGSDNDMRSIIFKRHERDVEVKEMTPEGRVKRVYRMAKFGLPDPLDEDAYTESGLCAVNQGALLRLVIDPATPPELVQIIDMHWRAHAPEKSRTTFVDSNLVNEALGEDGRLRASWNSCGTDTWREACRSPNLMTLSKEKDD